MVLAVIGSTGRVGREVVKQALASGHSVRALARTADSLIVHPRLTVLIGNALDPHIINKLIFGSNAVISVIGQRKSSPKNLQEQVISIVISSMHNNHITRLVSLTGVGVPTGTDQPQPLSGHLVTALIKKIAPGRFEDGMAHSQLIHISGLEWTIVRSPRITNSIRHTSFKTGYLRSGLLTYATKADVASFILECVVHAKYRGEMPMIISHST